MKGIFDSLRARINASTALLTACGSRIYLDEAPANTPTPLVVYSSVSATVEPHFGNQKRYTLDVDFLIVYTNAGNTAIWTIAQELETAMATPIAAVSGSGIDRVTAVKVAGGVPSFDDDAWTMTERYRLTAWDI
jgi:hypothetical protein